MEEMIGIISLVFDYNLKKHSEDKSCLVSKGGNIVMPEKMVDRLIEDLTILNGMVDSMVDREVDSTVLRFLKPVPAFVAEDLRTYGPFQPDDVVTVPSLNAKGLISKGFALLVNLGRTRTEEPSKVDSPPSGPVAALATGSGEQERRRHEARKEPTPEGKNRSPAMESPKAGREGLR